MLLHYFDQYLNNGGFPDWLNTQNKEILQLIYDDIVYRDIIGRYGINEIKSFKQLSQFLSTNIAKEFSYNSLAKSLNIKSTTSVRNYVDYLQSAYLMYELYKYDYSLKKQFINQKKIYSIDNGLRNNISFVHTSDSGRLLENIVFIELKRRGENVFFYKGKNECDFLIHQSGKITTLLQVCYTINAVNETRELSGLIEAAKIFNLNSGIIITYDQCDTFIKEGIEINIVAIWKWLLNI
ncbi:MAG: ATP-binding protein [Bacteroidota bacterium]